MMSSLAEQQFRHIAASPYASGMGKVNIGFGARLKAARTDAGLSGTALGKGLQGGDKDASRATISDWEAERHYPNVWQLQQICVKLSKSADYLLFGDISPTSEKMVQAKVAVEKLNPDERAALVAALGRAPVSDEDLEEKMPVTRRTAEQRGGK